MAIPRIVFGNQSLEKVPQIEHNIRIGVLLNDQGSGSVLNEHRQQAGLNAVGRDPLRRLARKWIKTFAAG
jgi:hypothetical protein